MSKKWNLFTYIVTYIGSTACMILIIFNNDNKFLDVFCSAVIGMNIMLIICALLKKRKVIK